MTQQSSSTEQQGSQSSPQVNEPPKEVLSQTFADDPVLETTPDTGTESGESSATQQTSEQKPKVESSDSTTEQVAPEKIVREQSAATGEQVKPVVKPAVLGEKVKPSDSQRDYTGFTPEQITHLRRLPNDVFNFIKDTVKEKKELEKVKQDFYLQNPNAYQLDPQFQKLQEDVSYVSRERQHWQEQLLKIKAGEKWTPLMGWDKTGKPVYGQPQTPTDVAEEDVRQQMMYTSQMLEQAKGQLGQLQQSYGQRVQQDVNAIKQIQAEKFAWAADPKVLEHNVQIEGVGDRSIKQIKQDFFGLLPAYQHSNPITDVAADMFVALQIYASRIRALESQLNVSEIKRGDAMRAEPSSSVKPAKDGTPASKFGGPATFSDLPEL